MSTLRLHRKSSPLFLRPTTPWARRFEKWLRTQKLADGRPIVDMHDAATLLDLGYQTATMVRSGRKTPGKLLKRLLEAYMDGSLKAPGA